jgi:hypothetical protein
MEIIPTQPIPSQVINVILSGQATTIALRQLSTGLFMNLMVGGTEIVGLVICENLNRIVRDLYLGFKGDLLFLDNSGSGTDPNYLGLGTQFSLAYLSPSDLPVGIG